MRINLLPWREEQRRKRQQGFLLAVCIAVCSGGLAVSSAKFFVRGLLADQHAGNDMIRAEIDSLDLQIEEIVQLESHRNSLLARMRTIVELQRARPHAVRLLDELVDILPAGVQLVEVDQDSSRVVLSGVAESSSRVAALMRNIEISAWLRAPQLELVETAAEGPARSARFTIVTEQVAPQWESIQ